MKRIIIYVLLLAVTLLVPVRKADVARLRPIEVIALHKSGDTVTLLSDTQDRGEGSNVLQALADMKQTSPAIIYLDTAEYLLVGEGAQEEVDALRSVLGGGVRLCSVQDGIDPKEAAAYLPVHGTLPTLRTWQLTEELPLLTEENGQIKLLEKR